MARVRSHWPGGQCLNKLKMLHAEREKKRCFEMVGVLVGAAVSALVSVANALVAGVPRQAWKLGKGGSSRGQGHVQARTKPFGRAHPMLLLQQHTVELALVDRNLALVWMW